jgi:hypothetical protein
MLSANPRTLTELIGKKDITYSIRFEGFPDLSPVKMLAAHLILITADEMRRWGGGKEKKSCASLANSNRFCI